MNTLSPTLSWLPKIAVIIIGFVAIVSSFLPWYSNHLALQASAHSHDAGDDALHIAKDAVRLNPFSVDAKFTLAAAQQRRGLKQDAKQTLKEATEQEPLNYQTWQQLAWYEIQYWNRPQDGKQHYQQAVNLNPTDKPLKEEAKKETGQDIEPQGNQQ